MHKRQAAWLSQYPWFQRIVHFRSRSSGSCVCPAQPWLVGLWLMNGTITEVHNDTCSSIQDRIWCITIGRYKFFGSNVGSAYDISPPAIVLTSWPRDFFFVLGEGCYGSLYVLRTFDHYKEMVPDRASESAFFCLVLAGGLFLKGRGGVGGASFSSAYPL